jgi:hypothetical protein
MGLASAAQASVLPCILANLHGYDTSGFACSEGNLTFSNFTFTDSGNALPLLVDTDVEVTPLSDGFDFTAAFSAPTGTALDVVIGYTVMVNPGMFTADQLTMAGFGISGTGSIDIAETVCVGAAFTPSHTCPTTEQMLNVFDNSGGFVPSASTSFSTSPTVLGIIKDLSVVGGTGLSSAQVSLVDNVTPFSTSGPPVADAPPFLLVGSGLAAVSSWFKKRRKKT